MCRLVPSVVLCRRRIFLATLWLRTALFAVGLSLPCAPFDFKVRFCGSVLVLSCIFLICVPVALAYCFSYPSCLSLHSAMPPAGWPFSSSDWCLACVATVR